MHRELGAAVDIVDNDRLAADLARRLLGRLARGQSLRVVQADAASAEDMAKLLAGCSVVVIAALVGRTHAEKQAVLRAVGRALDPGAYLVVRSAQGLRSLLYAVVQPGDVSEAADCEPQVLVHPLGDVVNSVLVARR
jgi:nicotianamine synthase